MRIAAMFVWIVLPVAAYLIYAVLGLPHFIWAYRFEDNGHPYDLAVRRTYTDCTYWGPYGQFTLPAEAGRCGWINFLKPAAQ